MKNLIIIGIMATMMVLVGCGKKAASISLTPSATTTSSANVNPYSPRQLLLTKATSIVLPEFKVDNLALSDVMGRLSEAAFANDPHPSDAERKQLNFLLYNNGGKNPKITLTMTNVTLMQAVDRVALVGGASLTVKDYGFLFEAK
jgi:hypothetical protein